MHLIILISALTDFDNVDASVQQVCIRHMSVLEELTGCDYMASGLASKCMQESPERLDSLNHMKTPKL